VRTSPWGYGRAVYVQLKDGRFAVWAHLSGFSDGIEKYVREEQDRRETYSVNLYFRPDQLPVKKGDVLGFSGSTGIGVPHLHFELRDGDHRPINPLTQGFDISDTTPPTLSAIGLVPLNAQSVVQGTQDPQAFALGWNKKKGQFTHTDTLTVWGQVGVGVRVYDRADASILTNKLAPYRIRLIVDEKEVFATTFDEFGYGVTHHGELDRNFMMSQRGLGRFHNLYRKAGNYLPFYGSYRIGDGVLHAGGRATRTGLVLPRGIHRVKILAEDVQGNISEAVVVVRVAELPHIQTLDVQWLDQAITVRAKLHQAQRARFFYSQDEGQTWRSLGKWLSASGDLRRTLRHIQNAIYRLRVVSVSGQEAFVTFVSPIQQPPTLACMTAFFPTFSVVKIKTDKPLSGLPHVFANYPDGQKRALRVKQVDLLAYEAVVEFDARVQGDIDVEVQSDGAMISAPVVQQAITKRQGGTVASGDDMARVRFERDGVYETLFGRVIEERSLVDERMVGTAYRLMPDDVAFEKAEVILRYPDGVSDTSKVGIYTWNKKKGWVFVDIGRDSGIYAVNGEVKHLGIFALLIDDVPPQIRGLRPAQNQVVSERQPKVLATIRDVSSGIWREEDIEIRLNGKKLIVEFDPEEDLIFAKPRKPLAVGRHQVEVVVRDICGNEARQIHAFVIK
ncbi:MAG: M23 family metallopeptidase, partial [Candidatus Latescibacteria bacterium]|nr:M23 family metallopeptidase [Candidatus Latescibacterota bacterium]